jgi:hypothetical protein
MMLRKLVTVAWLGALPAGAVGLYAAHQSHFSTVAMCRDLRGAILATLDQNVDPQFKRALVHKELTAFERTCALTDPEARAVFAALDRAILFATDPDAARSRPVRLVPPPFPPPFFDRQRGPGHGPGLFRPMRDRPFNT